MVYSLCIIMGGVCPLLHNHHYVVGRRTSSFYAALKKALIILPAAIQRELVINSVWRKKNIRRKIL